MPETEDAISRISEKLDRLRHVDSGYGVFGAAEHRYALGTSRTASELSELERVFGIQLPNDYRAFLTGIGDGINSDRECGGAGPGYGLYSIEVLHEIGNRVCLPFPLSHSILGVVDLEESDDCWPVWKDADGRRQHGSLPLAHYGCGIFAKLILTGDAYGTVWIVDDAVGDIAHFADHCRYHASGGGETVHGGARVADGPHSFTKWYEDWLDANLNPSTDTEPRDPEYLPGALIVPARSWEPLPEHPCPKCGKPLRTALAKQCLQCGADWHDP